MEAGYREIGGVAPPLELDAVEVPTPNAKSVNELGLSKHTISPC